jgi:hypothetical protein
MAIARDASAGGTSTGTTNTWAHTVGSLTNGALLIGISGRGSGLNNTTSVTYAGVPCSLIHAFRAPATGLAWLELWQLTNPPAGTANVVATYGTSQAHSGVSISYSGVIQFGWFDLIDEQSEDGSASLTWSQTSILANSWLLVVGETFTTATLTFSGALTFVRQSDTIAMADSNGTVTVGGHSVTVTTTVVDIEAIGLIIEPAGGQARVLFPLVGLDI